MPRQFELHLLLQSLLEYTVLVAKDTKRRLSAVADPRIFMFLSLNEGFILHVTDSSIAVMFIYSVMKYFEKSNLVRLMGGEGVV